MAAAPVAIVVDAIDALVTIDAERIETRSAQLGVEQGEQLSGAFPLGDGQGAAKILDVQALLAETFARRVRADSQARRAASSRRTRHEAAAEAREAFVTFDVAGQEFALDLGLVQEIIALPGAITAAPRVDKHGRRHDGVSRAIASSGVIARIARLRACARFRKRARRSSSRPSAARWSVSSPIALALSSPPTRR